MRNEQNYAARQGVEERVGEGPGDASEAPVGVEERRPGVEADSQRHDLSLGPRRIVHISLASERGGLLGVVEALATAQARRHVVAVVSPLRPRVPEHVPWMELALPGNRYVAAHWRLWRLVRRWGADIAVVHAGSPGEGALAAALLSLRLPTVVVEHLAEYFPLHRRGLEWAYAALKGRAMRWLAVSAAGAAHLERTWRLRAGAVGTVYCGVDAPLVEPRPMPAAVVGFGRPGPRKGFDVFTAVANALAPEQPALAWRWVGGETAARQGAVELAPWQVGIGAHLASAALVLVPSRAEGLPLVLLEAWSMGRPVVASRVGGIPEAVEDGRNGVLLEPGNLPAWVATVRRLLADAPARHALGEAGRHAWQDRFTVEAMASRFEQVMAAALLPRQENAR